MVDPVGVAGSGALTGHSVTQTGGDTRPSPVSFKQVLQQEIATVNELQQDAHRAVETRSADVDTVLRAAEQADAAFRMLEQVRSQVVVAYRMATTNDG